MREKPVHHDGLACLVDLSVGTGSYKVGRQTQRVKDLKAQRALRTHKAVDAFVTEAELLREYNTISAQFRPGGSVWCRCSRSGKQRLRSAVYQADYLAKKGELRAALRELCGE